MKNKIESIIFLFFSILFLFYVFYRSEIIHHGEKSHYYNKYYILSLIFIIFSSISFSFKKKTLQNLSIILISTITSLFIIESFLVITKKNFHFKSKKFDNRTLFKVYDDLYKQDKNIVVQVNPAEFKGENDDIIPLSSFSSKKVINCNENGYWTINNNDRYGFNNNDNIWEEKNVDFLIIGDSFAHGWCVNYNQSISGVLKNDFDKSAINLAQPANDPLMEFASLKEYYPTNIVIKNILMFYYEGNDLRGLNSSLENQILSNYLSNRNFSQKLKYRQKEIEKKLYSKFEEAKKEEIKKLKLKRNKYIRFLILNETRSLIKKSLNRNKKLEFKPNLESFEKIIQKIDNFAENKGIDLIFIYIPDVRRYVDVNNERNYFYNEVINIIKKNKINFLDLKNTFSQIENPKKLYSYPVGNHFNEMGYKKVADLLMSYFENEK